MQENLKMSEGCPLLIGSSLGFIVGVVGSLDFFNATLTEITTHHTKLAVHQYIGMTTRQLQTMLALERLKVE